MSVDAVRVWAPGSLSNLGPGFDSLGAALEGVGDVVTVRWTDRPGVSIEAGGGPWEPPIDVARNTAARAVESVLASTSDEWGMAVSVYKGILPGSGLGSSAASAAGAAWAARLLVNPHSKKHDALDAALDGEAVVAGARHGDNVLPALMGGLVLVSASDPASFRRIRLDAVLHVAIVRPDVEILTKQARAMLPANVPLRDAVHNASSLAFMIDAFAAGDLETVGRMIEQDRLVEPVRATLLPGFDAIRSAAHEAGALGAALSGSGPTMFAFCGDADTATAVAAAMRSVAGSGAVAMTTTLDDTGARRSDLDRPERVI